MASSSRSGVTGERVVSWLLFIAALAGSLWLVRQAKPRSVPLARVDPISFVPAGTELIVTLDVEALARVAGPELLRAGGAQLLGLRQDCGFEPLLGLRRVALAVPSRQGAEASDFALIAETSLQVEQVLRCAETLIRKRAGRPVRSELGRFRAVRDQAKPGGEMAMRDDGVLVLSGGDYFRDVLDASRGGAAPDEKARLQSALHLGIRRKLPAGELTLTLLPGRLLPVPEVQALGLSVRVERRLLLSGFVGCSSPAACQGAQDIFERIKADLAGQAGFEAVGALKALRGEAGLEIAGQLPRESLGPLLAQLLAP